jgi:hypothetical protein
MKVHELVALIKITDQEAVVVIGEGSEPNLWLLVTGIVERRVSTADGNPDCIGPGSEPAIEIV